MKPDEPYTEGLGPVNREPDILGGYYAELEHRTEQERRDRLLESMDLVKTEDAIYALECGEEKFGLYRDAGLVQLGAGRQKFFRRSAVAAVMEAMAVEKLRIEQERLAREQEATDDGTQEARKRRGKRS